MRPILFPENAMTFTTNGLGRIMAIRGTVEREVNGIYEVEFDMSVEDKLFPQVEISKIVCVKPSPSKGLQAFRIYKISKPINGVVTVNAEHISYQLSFIPVLPYQATSCADALAKITTYSAETNPFTFSTDKQISANWSTPDVPISARALLQGEEGSILQRFKGEYDFDNWNVTLKTHLGTNRGVVIRYGKNLVDLLQEENIENTYTGIAPYYKSDDYLLTLPEKVLHSSRADNFPYQRTIPVDLSDKFEAIPTEAELRAMGQAYITENDIGVPEVSLEVEFVPLADTQEYKSIAPLETVELGDTVGVYFEKLGVNASAEVVRTIYEFVKERYDKVEIGSVKSSLSSTLAAQQSQIENQKTWVETVVQTATDMINGGLGGYVRTTVNAAGQPQEILIMDTDDTSTATNVIRLNQNGIGFSTTGYNGPFNSAWTIDGTFDASVINVINLVAQKLQSINSDETYKVDIDDGLVAISVKRNGEWVQRAAIGKSGVINADASILLGNAPSAWNDETIKSEGKLFIGLSPLQSFINATIRFYSTLYLTGANANIWLTDGANIGFASDGKLVGKNPSWISSGNGYVLSGDGVDMAPLALKNLKQITSGDDLNNYYTAGAYSIPSNSDAQGISHTPVNAAGRLIVESRTGGVDGAGTWRYMRQIYTPLSSNGYSYERVGSTGSGTTYTWGAWAKVGGLEELSMSTKPLSSGSATVLSAMLYSKLIIYGKPSSSSSILTCTVVPTALLTTTNKRFQINDEANFVSFDLKILEGGTAVAMTFGNASSSGSITNVYGEN